ncbi:MAG: oligopeptide transporter, OPT family [Butyrivibrio sp.]|nr:oligopeptide transporter, OPT family [Butyrivibrio sp.]
MQNEVKKDKEFKPFIPADKVMPEMTVMSIFLGLILSVVFGAANAYLGLMVGMTVSASIPAAVISMGIIRFVFKKDSILENNMVQTIGSAGESLAAGAIFTLPALFMWAEESEEAVMPSFITITIIALLGGILGVLFMVPLRTALVVEEHGKLPFPEGTACAEVLLAGEEGGEKSKAVFSGLGISTIYKFLSDGFKVFPSEIHFEIPALRTGFGADVLPALVGVGYITGLKISSYLLAGGAIGWFVIIPLISFIGGDSIIAPGTTMISAMDSWEIRNSYLKYIAAGAVAAGGIISLLKTLPAIIKAFTNSIKQFGHKEAVSVRTNKDLPMSIVIAGTVIIMLLIWLLPSVPVNLIGAIIIIVFGFFFATVSGRMVGLVGSSNNPVSGMVIASLLIATTILKLTGNTGYAGMTSAICIGTIICIVAAMAADTSQDLKTGYIVGATPIKQQIGEFLGAIVAALSIGGIMLLLNKSYGFGEGGLSAPQATLMKMVVEGVMNGTLPWDLIMIGVAIAIVIEIMHMPVLPVAIGLYLPIHLSVPMVIGGLLRSYFEKKKKNDAVDKGILYCAGLIAGEGIIGILLAVLALITINGEALTDVISLEGVTGNAGAVIFFALLCVSVAFFSTRNKKKN